MTSKAKPYRRRARRAPAVEFITIELPNGQSMLYVCDVISESDPPAVREGIARRRTLALTGECPCGARSPFDPSKIAPSLVIEAIYHESDCPATAENMARAMRAGKGGTR